MANSQFITILKIDAILQSESRPSANRESIDTNRCPGIKASGEYSEPNDDEDGLNEQLKASNNQEFWCTRFEIFNDGDKLNFRPNPWSQRCFRRFC
jgi:hypothetical protein